MNVFSDTKILSRNICSSFVPIEQTYPKSVPIGYIPIETRIFLKLDPCSFISIYSEAKGMHAKDIWFNNPHDPPSGMNGAD